MVLSSAIPIAGGIRATGEYPLTDALGSVYALTDSTGATAHQYDYDVWGVRTDLGGSGPGVDFGYTGRWHDANGLVDHRDRQRNPRLGGWLQSDRASVEAVPSAYLYALAAPISLTDPSGRQSEDQDWVINHVPPYLWSHPGVGDYLRMYTVAQAIKLGDQIRTLVATVPTPTNGDTLDGNISETLDWWQWGVAWLWWPLHVVPSGPWDYWGRPPTNPALSPFTQLNVGATGSAAGYPDVELLWSGDVSQAFMDVMYYAQGNPHSVAGNFSLGSPFFYSDDPKDKAWIEAGILYFYFAYLPRLTIGCK